MPIIFYSVKEFFDQEHSVAGLQSLATQLEQKLDESVAQCEAQRKENERLTSFVTTLKETVEHREFFSGLQAERIAALTLSDRELRECNRELAKPNNDLANDLQDEIIRNEELTAMLDYLASMYAVVWFSDFDGDNPDNSYAYSQAVKVLQGAKPSDAVLSQYRSHPHIPTRPANSGCSSESSPDGTHSISQGLGVLRDVA